MPDSIRIFGKRHSHDTGIVLEIDNFSYADRRPRCTCEIIKDIESIISVGDFVGPEQSFYVQEQAGTLPEKYMTTSKIENDTYTFTITAEGSSKIDSMHRALEAMRVLTDRMFHR